MPSDAASLLAPNSPLHEPDRLVPFPTAEGERNKRGRTAVLAKVRRIHRGEVVDVLLGDGPTREWRVIHECLKQGIPLEITGLQGKSDKKREAVLRWKKKWENAYPILKLACCNIIDPDTFIVYFRTYKE